MTRLGDWLHGLKNWNPGNHIQRYNTRTIWPGPSVHTTSGAIIRVSPLHGVAARPGETMPEVAHLLEILGTEKQPLQGLPLADDIGALLSLTADRRIEVAMEISATVEGKPENVTFMPLGPTLDRRARGPIPDHWLEEFLGVLCRLPSLDPKDGERIESAMRLHHAAMILVEKDPRAAYVLVVAGLEVLSRHFGKPPTSWIDWEEHEVWEGLFDEIAIDDAQREGIRARLMKNKHLRLKQTFAEYASKQLPEAFLKEEWKEWLGKIKVDGVESKWDGSSEVAFPLADVIPSRDVLYAALRQSYDLRSGIVHAGQDVVFYTMAIKPDEPLTGTDPVPYALLRQILRALIIHETLTRSTPAELPDVKINSPE